MIETAEQLYQAIEQMGRMQRILESYRNELLAKNPRNFAILAEGPLEQLRQLMTASKAWKTRICLPIADKPDHLTSTAKSERQAL